MKDCFVFRSKGKYVAMDRPSGDPYLTEDPFQTKVWSNQKEAEEYREICKEDWTLYKVVKFDLEKV